MGAPPRHLDALPIHSAMIEAVGLAGRLWSSITVVADPHVVQLLAQHGLAHGPEIVVHAIDGPPVKITGARCCFRVFPWGWWEWPDVSRPDLSKMPTGSYAATGNDRMLLVAGEHGITPQMWSAITERHSLCPYRPSP